MEIQRYLEYVNTLKYEQEPDYEHIRKLFRDGLKRRGCTDDGKNVKLTSGQASPPSATASTELCNGHDKVESETRDNASRKKSGARVRNCVCSVLVSVERCLGSRLLKSNMNNILIM